MHEQRVRYPSSDQVTLSAWVVPAAPARASGMWVLICHGNLGNIGFGQRPEFYALMRDLGVALLAFDYRGFGESTGAPEEHGLYAEARASYDYLTRTLGVPPDHIVIFGHSLGSGVAIELASRVPAAGLIVEGAYTSLVDRGQELYPLLPVRLVASQRFPSIERISSIAVPTLFLHSPEDKVIPYAHGQRLFEAAREYDQRHAGVKTVVTLTGANERAVRNWFDAKNGPNGEFLIALCRHSDQVLDTVLVLAGRTEHVRARKLVEAADKIREMLRVIDELGQH